MVAEIAFLVMSWLTMSKDSPSGSTSESSARPTVVSTVRRRGVFTPSTSTTSSMRTLMRACRWTSRVS